MLVKNPMQRVDAPKKVKKAIDALTPEQANQFFALLPSCDLDFRCMLHLFIQLESDAASAWAFNGRI